MSINDLLYQIREMDNKEIIVFKNHLLMETSKINDSYADEIAEIATVNFDPDSYWGKKKIDKIAKKYAEQSSGIDYLIELVNIELGRRNMLNSQFGQSSDDEQDIDAFLESEELKTMAYREDIDND